MTTGAIVFDHGDDRGLSWAAFFRSLRAASVYLLIALATALVLAAIWPLWRATFSFSDLFRSRILLAAAALPAAAALSEVSGSKFNLDRFRINPRMGFTINLSGKLVRFLLVGLALAVPLFVIDPIGVYAESHSKALVSLFYITDRATVPGPSPNSIIFTNDPSSPEALTFGVGTVPLRWSRSDVIRNLRSRVSLSTRPGRLALQNLLPDDFREQVRAAAQSSDRRDAFLFVHGFHTPFDQAIDAAAKLSYGLKFQGAGILYSWPSGDEVY
jgi:hypothetical protein